MVGCCGEHGPWRALMSEQQHSNSRWMVVLKALLYVHKWGDYVPKEESKLFLNPQCRRAILTTELEICRVLLSKQTWNFYPAFLSLVQHPCCLYKHWGPAVPGVLVIVKLFNQLKLTKAPRVYSRITFSWQSWKLGLFMYSLMCLFYELVLGPRSICCWCAVKVSAS